MTEIIVITLVGIFIVGGLIISHLASKTSYDNIEQTNKDKSKK